MRRDLGNGAVNAAGLDREDLARFILCNRQELGVSPDPDRA
jgi:hypothetical protein